METIVETNDHRLIAQLNREVQELHAQLYPGLFKPYDAAAITEAMEKHMANPAGRSYVAYVNGEPAGYAIFMLREVPDNAFHYARRSLYIDQLGVLNAFRGAGVGRLLLQQAEQLAASQSITRIELDHWSSNTVAATFFRKHGYTLCREQLYKVIA